MRRFATTCCQWIFIGGWSVLLALRANSDASPQLPANFAWRSAAFATGGRPEEEPAFEALKEAGIRLLVSVDGAAPDVAAAKRHGLRYVHIPMTYEGISMDGLSRMKRLLDEKPGTMYVHCHHG